jgi:tetratricopeptide (TPR) repeat protein
MGLRELNGEEIGRLADALKRAFPKREMLAEMVRVGLDENLDDIATRQGLGTHELVEWAEAQGKTEALIKAARAANPGNPRLREVAEELLGASSSSAAASLPARPAWFVGRDALAAELKNALLAEQPVPVLILGTAGIGKSTLTLAVLHDAEIAKHYGARRYFVRLDAADTADKAAAAIALAMRLPPGPDPRRDTLAALACEKTLLALDNGETPWEGEGSATEALFGEIAGVPGVGLVVSVRGDAKPGGVRCKALRVRPLEDAEAVALFCQIADEHRSDDPAVVALVKKLAGVPLAIDLLGRAAQSNPIGILAAEWERQRTAMLKRLGAESNRLSSWSVSIELSMDSRRMTGDARRLASVLAALPDGVAEIDVGKVMPEVGPAAALVLAQVGLAYWDKGRLLMLAPVREHLVQVHPASENDLLPVMDFYGWLAKELGPKPGNKGGREAVDRLTPEVGNLEAMIRRGLGGDKWLCWVDRTVALGEFAWITGQCSPSLFELARDKARIEGDRRREAYCIFRLGKIALVRSEHDMARRMYEEARPLYQQVGNVLGEANCIRRLGEIALVTSEHETARRRYEEAQPLYQQVGEVLGEANCIYCLGEIARARSEYEVARRRYEEAQPLYQQVGSALGEANCIQSLGDIAQATSEHETARRRYEEARTLYQQVGSVHGEASCLSGLGDIAAKLSARKEARQHYEAALALHGRISDPYSIGRTHRRLARISSGAEQARHLDAARSALTCINRPDLLAKLDAEFSAKP